MDDTLPPLISKSKDFSRGQTLLVKGFNSGEEDLVLEEAVWTSFTLFAKKLKASLFFAKYLDLAAAVRDLGRLIPVEKRR